jgi:Zn finger protein HypA/HybF involved in hydrogenase expression
MSFGSNVQPKRRLREAREDWYCHRCDEEVKRYLPKCPQCSSPRAD